MAVQVSAGGERSSNGRTRETQPAEAIRDTLTLINELSEALVSQIQRARRQFSSQPGLGFGSSDLDLLEKQALRLRRKSLALSPSAPELEEPRGGDDNEQSPSPEHGAGGDGTPEDAARTLAMELNLEGRSPEEAERVLKDFGFENAATLVADAWGPQPTKS